MASSSSSSSSLLFLSLFIFLVHQTDAIDDPRTDIISRRCERLKYTNTIGSSYMENYYYAINQVTNQFLHDTFGKAVYGDPPSRIYVMGQCHGDLTPLQCSNCFANSHEILTGCFPHAGGRVYLDGCFVRAANYSFFHESVSDQDTRFCGLNVETKEGFRRMVKSLINDSIAQAAQNNGYGTASNEFNSNTFYALANCWRTVDEEHCLTCLESASSTILSCMPATEGRALNAGCILKYSDQNLPRNHESIEAVKDFLLYVAYILVIITLGISTGLYIGRIAYSHRNKRQLKALKGVESDGSLFMRSLRFKSSTIEKATNHFSESQKLGQGGFGEVFKGILPDGREIAVKRLFICTASKNEDVFNEMNVISRAQHQNLVRFLGCCLTPNDSLLVYEFLANKSLDRVLFDPEKKKELDWKKRHGIIIGMAEGLQYLHNECPEKIVHRDIKASNILLDLKYRPKIADFGLAQSYETGAPQLNTAIAGTLGYMAPEYIARGQLTEKVDVFSYGIVVLEIISGERNNSFKSDESLETLVVSTWKHFQSNTISEIVDQSLEIDDPEEVTKVAQVGLLCTQEIASLRPTMKEIIQMLTQKDVQLSQPSKPPFVDETMEISHLSNSSQFSGPCNSQILQNDFR